MTLKLECGGKIIERGMERDIGPAQLSLYGPLPDPGDLVIAMVSTIKRVRVVWNNDNDPPLELDGFYLTDWRSWCGRTIANYMSQTRSFMKVPFGATS